MTGERGSAVVETALVLPVVLIVLLAGLEVTRGGVGSLATVRVRLRRPLVTPLLQSFAVELRSRAVMRVER